MEKIASIKDIFQQTNRLLFSITLIPLLVISIFYTRNILIYRSALANVEEANAVSTIVQENVLEELWDLVFGLIKVTDYESGNELEKVRLAIEEIQANTTTAKEAATLDVALRTLDTLDNYISEMESNIANGRPFAENEAIMVQVDAVTVLLYAILQDFVRVEIELAGKTSDDMLVSLYYLILFELVIVLIIVYYARKNNRFLTQQIQEPLNDLIVLSEELSQGHLDYRAKEPEVAELRVVTESMNDMARNLHVLIEENAVKQFDLAQSELRVLQAQITPHFIYNTLDAILSLGRTRQQRAGEDDDLRPLRFPAHFLKQRPGLDHDRERNPPRRRLSDDSADPLRGHVDVRHRHPGGHPPDGSAEDDPAAVGGKCGLPRNQACPPSRESDRRGDLYE